MENKNLCSDVEDIMCDQVVLSEVDVDFKAESSRFTTRHFKLAITLLTKTVIPAVVGVYYVYLRNKEILFENVRKSQYFATTAAFLANSISKSLASVQRGITYRLTFRQIDAKQTQKNESLEADQTDEEVCQEKCVECVVLAEPEGPVKADVVFIHGLHGGLMKTWRQGTWRHEKHKYRHESLKLGLEIMKFRKRNSVFKCESSNLLVTDDEYEDVTNRGLENDNNGLSPCWPQDWLPKDCPGIRVIALNYTTDPYLWRPIWVKKRNRTSMAERSKEMIAYLRELNVGNYPIVWVAHSKGGLFVKQILVDCFENKCGTSSADYLYKQTKGIMFYSVPHKGSYLADINLPFVKQSIELLEIKRNCPFVMNLHEKFMNLFETGSFCPLIYSFIETSFTLMSIFYLRIVAFDSADPGIGIKLGVPLDHREICKPAGRDCFLYLKLVRLIETIFSNHERDEKLL